MKARARVHDVREGRVRLACETAQSACGACAGARGCALRWLARADGALLELPGPPAATGHRPLRPGDGVVVEVDDGELLKAALIAYLPPLVGLLAAPAVSALLLPHSELAAVIAALPGLALGSLASRVWLRRSPPRCRIEQTATP